MKHRLLSSVSDGTTDTQIVLHTTNDPFAFKATLDRVADAINGRPPRRRLTPGNAKPCTLVALVEPTAWRRYLSTGRIVDQSIFKPGASFASTTQLAQALGMAPRSLVVQFSNTRRKRRTANLEASDEFMVFGWRVKLHEKLATFGSPTVNISVT